MSDVSDIDDRLEEDAEAEAEEEEDLDDAEPTEEDLEAAADLPPDPATGGDTESIQELLVKQEAQEEDEQEEDEPAVTLTKDDHSESTLDTTRVVPMQESEFQCRNCFLVKNRSQLADKKKMLCRDCA
jgi:hypothetical protein